MKTPATSASAIAPLVQTRSLVGILRSFPRGAPDASARAIVRSTKPTGASTRRNACVRYSSSSANDSPCSFNSSGWSKSSGCFTKILLHSYRRLASHQRKSAVQLALDGCDRLAEHPGNLVRQHLLLVAEDDRDAQRLGQRAQQCLKPGLGADPNGGRVGADVLLLDPSPRSMVLMAAMERNSASLLGPSLDYNDEPCWKARSTMLRG